MDDMLYFVIMSCTELRKLMKWFSWNLIFLIDMLHYLVTGLISQNLLRKFSIKYLDVFLYINDSAIFM